MVVPVVPRSVPEDLGTLALGTVARGLPAHTDGVGVLVGVVVGLGVGLGVGVGGVGVVAVGDAVGLFERAASGVVAAEFPDLELDGAF